LHFNISSYGFLSYIHNWKTNLGSHLYYLPVRALGIKRNPNFFAISELLLTLKGSINGKFILG